MPKLLELAAVDAVCDKAHILRGIDLRVAAGEAERCSGTTAPASPRC